MRQIKISNSITNRDSASMERYLSEIARQPLLTPDEEVELARRIREGDMRALEKLTICNLRFVVSIAKKYQNQGISLPDLVNEGNMGLLKAAQRFDETRGFKFISYAVWWIRQSILTAIADQARVVRLPLNQVGTISKIKKEISRLEQQYQRFPTVDEIAEAVDLPPYKVADLLRMNGFTQSLDAPISTDDDTKLVDTYIPENASGTDDTLMKESLSTDVDTMLSDLPEKEKEVIRLFFGLNNTHEHTLDEISVQCQISRERVRQLKEKAIKRLRTERNHDRFKPYL
ncbi:MAG: sigma-70 family RNA polymerase sigma factor [Bacteroidales bacterium]|nr:sigma-70 family RNA polymerase sigma factor [Bacteroidales bacterium]